MFEVETAGGGCYIDGSALAGCLASTAGQVESGHANPDDWAWPLSRAAGDVDGKALVPLPLASDGRPVVPGELVVGQDGMGWKVTRVCLLALGSRLATYSVKAVAADGSGKVRDLRPEWLRHMGAGHD